MDTSLADIQQDGERVKVAILHQEVATDALRELINQLKDMITQDNARTFVFAMDKVEFLPSACLALLLMFYQEVKKHDGRIVLLDCQENVAFLLRLARLDSLFELAQGNDAES